MNETIEHAGCRIDIWQDSACESPREGDNLGTMVLSHGHYSLPDESGLDLRAADDYSSWEAVETAIIARVGPCVTLPVYMYDHSGIGLSTDNSRYPFNCPWDSGQVGFIYVAEKRIVKEYGDAGGEAVGKAKAVLRTEVAEYSRWLNGECYGYTIRQGDEEGDSCGGFIGYDFCLQEAKQVAEGMGASITVG